jgi:uncharacterized membrane protein
MGSWGTPGSFTAVTLIYLALNTFPGFPHFDPYPFEFMTFAVSIIANYQAMIVMISQKGQLIRDRIQQAAMKHILLSILANSEATHALLQSQREATKTLTDMVRVLQTALLCQKESTPLSTPPVSASVIKEL